MNIQKLIDLVIPPADFEHRNGFNNFPILDGLDRRTRSALEEALIAKLRNQSLHELDALLIDTLGYMDSYRALPLLRELLDLCTDNKLRIVLATAIFQISGDKEAIPIAIDAAREIEAMKGPYRVSNLTLAFYYLAKFNTDEITELLENFSNDEDDLIAYNAKRALNLKGAG